MKRRITFLLAALLLTCGLTWAQQITWSAAGQGYVNGETIESVDFNDYVSAEFFKGTNNNPPKYYTTGAAIRCYGGNYFTVTSDYLLTEITFGFASGEGTNAITANVGTYENGTWTGSANEVTFTIGGTTGHRRFATFTITYTESGTPDPSITAENVSLDYDDEEGEIEYTINDPVEGGVLAAATEAEWLTIGEVGETVPFTCTVNEDGAAREGIITLTYTYGEQAINQNVTVTQAGNPNALNNISDITAAGAYAVQGTIVAKSQRGFIVGDGTGYVYYYNSSYVQDDYNIGDMVKLAGSVVVYGSVFEFNNTTTVTEATSSNYVAEDPTVITGAEMDARVASSTPALSNYVQYEGTLTISGSGNNIHYNITNIEGATTAKGSISYPLDTEFAALDGKHVIVKGYYVGISSGQYYNTMIGSVEEVVVTEPSITVANATVSVPAEGAESTLTVTYENITEIVAEVYFCDANGGQATYDWITAEINAENNIEYLVEPNDGEARTAYLKVYALGDNAEDVYSNLVTINQAEYVAPALDYATLPFEFDGTYNEIATTDGLTEEGLGNYGTAPHLKFDGSGDWLLLHFIETPGTLTFDLKANPGNNGWSGTFIVQTSEDGENYTDFATYTDISTSGQSEEFTNLGENVRYIKWIYDEKVSGNVALGNITLAQYTGPVATITVAPATVDATAEETTGTLTVTYENITEVVAEVYFCDANGETATYDWIVAEINAENNVDYIIDANEGEARTAYLKVYAMDDETNLVYSNLVTITQAAPVAPVTGDKYVKVTSTADLTSGQYLIVYEEGNVAFDGGLETLDAAGNTIGVTIQNDEISITAETAAAEFTIDMTAGTIKSASGLYIGQTSDANGMQSSDETAYMNTISIDEVGNAVVVSSDAHLRYNNASNQNRFRYYKSTSYEGQKAIQLYKKVLPANSIVIEGYGESEGGYYLIASPFTVSPEDVQGMTEGEYDLYSFDEAEENEWRNYKADAFTNLEPGKGYLYAHSTTVTLTFDGTPYDGEPIVLKKTTGGDFPGWNLVGNPYTETAYIARDFYVMNPETGGEIITGEGNEIAPMQGFFVIAANNDEELEISTTAPAEQGGKIVMNVSNGRSSVIDRAMVRFGEGRTLPKFMLNDENTKIYITEGNEEFAVVRSIDENATPVNFHAAENGTYTLSINTENVEMEYLHLLDNMTGADVDLLATPSYTFEARTTDYANRFKLVYATTTDVNENNVEPFAFFNGSEWVINNEGEAALQVIDINGRMLSNETVNGNANVNINATSGIYMLRLVNGESVKTQKVVVK